MEVTYRRNAGKSYMVIGGQFQYAGYQIEMCQRNKLDNFLEFDTVVADGKMEFWYDITGKTSLEEYVKYQKLGSRELMQLIGAVYMAQKEAEKYLLKEQSIQLSPGYIFIANGTKEMYVCYIPGIEEMFTEKFRMLMEYLLAYVDHGEEHAVTISYRMYQMTLEANFGMEEINNFIQEMEGTYERDKNNAERNEPKGIINMESENVAECVEEEQIPNGRQEKRELLGKWMSQGKKIIETRKRHLIHMVSGEKAYRKQMIFEPMENRGQKMEHQTVFLGTDMEERKMVKLVYMGQEDGQDVELVEDIYCVGSQEDADIVIRDETVSRLHARINKSEGLYYIEDLNSRNGTWINGKMLHYLEKVALKNGDIIAFSDVKYRYEELV